MTEILFNEDDDRRRLASFVITVASDLDVVIELREQLFRLEEPARADVRQLLLGAMDDAWSEARENVGPLVESILSGEYEVELAAAGLTGAQLAFKLIAWGEAREALLVPFAESPDTNNPQSAPRPANLPPGAPAPASPIPKKVPRWKKWVLKKLGQTLSHADTLIESLASVINLSEPIKEVKKTVEKVAEDTADSLPDGPS